MPTSQVINARHHLAYIGLGANVGEAQITIQTAIRCLGALPKTCLVRASRLYRTKAWGHENQPDFINAVAIVDTQLSPEQLLEALQDLEQRAGRVRNPALRWGPRVLDLDVLVYGDQRIRLPHLCVPHPYLHQRAFVLVPLMEIAPDLPVPGLGTVRALFEPVGDCGIVAIAEIMGPSSSC